MKFFYTLIFHFIFLSAYAQTMEKQVYEKNISVVDFGYANDDKITISAYKKYELGQKDTMVFANIKILNTWLLAEPAGFNQRKETIVYDYSQGQSQGELKLFKQDVTKLLNCLNQIVPRSMKDSKEKGNIYCKAENLTLGYGDVKNKFSLEIGTETIYINKKNMLLFVAAIKELNKMVSVDAERLF
jgi:hypothetical protein